MNRDAIRRTGLIFLGLTLVLAADLLLRVGRQDHFWTPMELAPTALEATDRVRVYVDGEPISERPEFGDVRVRLNHKGEVVRERLTLLAFGLGLAVALLSVALFGRAAPNAADA